MKKFKEYLLESSEDINTIFEKEFNDLNNYISKFSDSVRYQFEQINKINKREDSQVQVQPKVQVQVQKTKTQPEVKYENGDKYYYKKSDGSKAIIVEIINNKIIVDDSGVKRIYVKLESGTKFQAAITNLMQKVENKVDVGAPKVKEAQPTTNQNLQDSDKKINPKDPDEKKLHNA